MHVEIHSPSDFQGSIMGGMHKRNGTINATDLSDDGSAVRILSDVPLSNMFGYSTELRSSTQGKGEFTMEYSEHKAVNRDVQEELIKAFTARQAGGEE
jgi:elongation factor G